MNQEAYHAYLQSDHWKSLRIQALKNAGYRCQVCNSPDGLDVHHRTYERVGNEQIGDLTVLCKRCHSLFHEQCDASGNAVTLLDGVRDAYARLDSRRSGSCDLPTGYLDLDSLIVGFQESELTVIAARPSIGKTAFILNVLRNITIEHGLPALLFSLEESRIEIAERMMCCQARINTHRLRTGHLAAEDFESLLGAGTMFEHAKLFINDRECQSTVQIVASARQLHEEHGIKAVFVDCIDLVEGGNARESRYEQVAAIGQRLRNLARELHIPVIVSARVKRSSEDRQDHRPRLADLGYAAGLEHDADRIILLHRPEYHEPGQHEGLVEVIVGKQRNGPTGEVTLMYVKEFMRFENFAVEASAGFGAL